MTELLTAAQMRAIEAAAIASGEVSGLELMERAGRGVVEAVFEEWPELRATSHRAVVLCGPGGNGGDGFVVARLLKDWGWEVEVFLYGTPEGMPPDARVNYERWLGMGAVRPLIPNEAAVWDNAKVIVDALFGIGLTRPCEVVQVWDLSDQADCDLCSVPVSSWDERWSAVVAVDVPSGVCSDSGMRLGQDMPWSQAHLTVTFERAKLGHFVADGPVLCGKTIVKPIGLPIVVLADAVTFLTRQTAIEERRPSVNKSRGPHKYSHGHTLILSGPSGRGGAARLAARGALRIGAGVVTVGCPEGAVAENAARLDAVMLRAVADGDALALVLEDRRINALCLGPGMGLGAREAGLVALALKSRGEPRPTVLDADALTLIAGDPALFAALHDACVLTPHAGEFSRLFPDIAAKLAEPAVKGPAYSKVDAAREAAARAGCVVLYKGPDTVIAGPDGRCAINSAAYERAAPWLATAGSGDVLAGFITGLLARGFSPFDAACTGAWLHVECARSFGPGLIAEDLPEELPKVFRALGL